MRYIRTRKGGKYMIKVNLLAVLFAGVAMSATAAHDAQPHQALKERDTRIIVEVDRSLKNLSKEGIDNTQNIVLNRIKSNVTSNIEVISRYSYLNNAFAISVNGDYVEQIKSLPGVKSVTYDKVHFKTYSVPTEDDYATGSMYEAMDTDGDHSGDIYGGEENVSATTMNKPDDTNDGEGTVVAILDNEFYLRTEHKEDGTTVPTWYHEVYTELPEGTNVKWETRPNISETFAVTDSRVRNKINNNLGKEGSLYLNNKVPYYFDYGGESKPDTRGKFYEDFDVSSEITFHGSHVSSITAANADHYKGIAPKAQLALMKVFTNLEADEIEKKLGFGDSTGAYDIPLLNALEDCMALGVDGINMSLGSDLNDFDLDSITLKTLQNLSNAGILTSISAGNAGKTSYAFAGPYGNWTTDMVETGILGSYANNHNSTSVASSHALKSYYTTAFRFSDRLVAYEDQILTEGFYAGSYTKEYKLEDLITDEKPTIDYVYFDGFGVAGDYTESVDGKIVIVNRGQTSFADKLDQASGHGAIGLVIINNDPTSTDFNFHISLGEITDPGMPIALCLFADKQYFKQNAHGTLTKDNFLGDDHVQDNIRAGTLSTYSSDGATFDLDLKPDITAPGDSIRGACPPQTKEDKLERPTWSYTFISGTSMSAPNYAGVQALMLSKETKSFYGENAEGKTLEDINKYKATIDMRVASTANPLSDYEYDPEYFELNAPNTLDPLDPVNDAYKLYRVSSPRIQGAGLVDIDSAYNTKVYLSGYDSNVEGHSINRTKINLRNNSEINSGKVHLEFDAHNEDSIAHSYDVSYSILRPAVKYSNEFVSSEYNVLDEIDSLEAFTGFKSWKQEIIPDESEQGYHVNNYLYTVPGNVKDNDVFKVSKDIEYYANEADLPTYNPETGKLEGGTKTLWKAGNYVYDSSINSTQQWRVLDKYPYQSTQDTIIETINCGTVVVEANGSTHIDLDAYQLSSTVLDEINKFFEYGTYLEGFVTMTETTDIEKKIDLSIPWMGFYAGEGRDYGDAPVVEPFDFEKEEGKIYPSDLINDISSSLMGKGNADFGSTMVSAYVEEGKEFNFDIVLENDNNLNNMAKNSPTINPMGEYTVTNEDGSTETKKDADHLYAGNPYYSNTIVLQQYVMRSVMDNYFTITNKETGEVYCKSVLLDSIYDRYYGSASQMGKYPLFKSHVDQSFMSGGVMAHRAYAIIPLYNPNNGEAFPSGDYELKFNYQLAANEEWVSNSYTLHIDSESPMVSTISSGDEVSIKIKDANLESVAMGGKVQKFEYNSDGEAVIKIKKNELKDLINDNFNEDFECGRLFVTMTDKAFGKNNAIIKFQAKAGAVYDDDFNPIVDYFYNNYTIVQARSLKFSYDFEVVNNMVHMVEVDEYGNVNPISIDEHLYIHQSSDEPYSYTVTTGGCGGNVSTTSIVLTALSSTFILLLAAVMIKNKKKRFGGK